MAIVYRIVDDEKTLLRHQSRGPLEQGRKHFLPLCICPNHSKFKRPRKEAGQAICCFSFLAAVFLYFTPINCSFASSFAHALLDLLWKEEQ